MTYPDYPIWCKTTLGVSVPSHAFFIYQMSVLVHNNTRIKRLTKQDEEMTEWDNFIYKKIHPFTAHPFAQEACSSSEIGHPRDKLRQKEKRKEEGDDFLKGRGKAVCLSLVSMRATLSWIQTAAIASQSALEEHTHPNSCPCAHKCPSTDTGQTQSLTLRGTESA